MHPVVGCHPNGATGARALAFQKASAFRAVGRVSGSISMVLSGVQAAGSFKAHHYEAGVGYGADTIMAGAGNIWRSSRSLCLKCILRNRHDHRLENGAHL